MTVNAIDVASPDFVSILAAAAASRSRNSHLNVPAPEKRPAPAAVTAALLAAEKAAKQQRLTYPFEAIAGTWQLRFFTGTRKSGQGKGIALGRGYYAPAIAPAQISFHPATVSSTAAQGEIGNQIRLGSLVLRLTGPAHYPGKKNLLAFDFTQMTLSLFGRTLYNGNIRSGKAQSQEFYSQSIAQLPFFAFFLATETFIAARGRGGGLALWVRV